MEITDAPLVRPGHPDAEPASRGDGVQDESGEVGAGSPAFDPSPDQPGLSEREQLILSFERRWWRYAGVKEQAIRETFGLSPTRYYQALNALLDRPEALAADPVLVNRLRRLRVARQRARSGRRTGTDS